MINRLANQRVYAFSLFLGAWVLIYRTLSMMLFEDAFDVLVTWVVVLLIIEFLIDFACMLASARWFITNDGAKATLPLWLGAAAAIFHAIRVLIYVLGRTGPWENFDVRAEHHSTYTFEWFWVYFAAALSVLGVIGVIVIWQLRLRVKNRNRNH